MNSRERVVQAMSHREPDRVPIDLGGTICSSLHRDAYVVLKRYLGLEVEEIKLVDHFQQLPYLDEALLEWSASDFRMIQLPAEDATMPPIFRDGDYYAFIDDWGARVHMPVDGGLYFDWVGFPIKEATQEALDGYAWPEASIPEDLARLRATAKDLYETTDFALTGSGITGGGIFEQATTIMGYESFLMALVAEPAFADQMMERITEIYIESSSHYLDYVGEYLHVFVCTDDVCGQDSWLISPELYRRMVKPKQRRLIEAIKGKTDAKVFYHGCGAVSDLIPELIDIGVDIINPLQASARGMDTRWLKKEYGRDIVFWGGGVDTQHVPPFGTPQEISDEVKRRIDDLAPGGGYIFAAVHNIQAQVPPENIVALFETALEYGAAG